jgi:hypothetical protein
MRKRDGTIPNNRWLENNGFGDLIQAMKEHPELFKHLKQKPTKRKTSAKATARS